MTSTNVIQLSLPTRVCPLVPITEHGNGATSGIREEVHLQVGRPGDRRGLEDHWVSKILPDAYVILQIVLLFRKVVLKL